MELWEVAARESIRDLVTRYNSNGDTGRFAQVLALFGPDATMELVADDGAVRSYHGKDEIETIFTGTKARWSTEATRRASPGYVRHCVFTHQIDFVDQTHARGRSYFQVLMAHGLDHWGRYLDEYEERDGRWVFARRRVTTDGRTRGQT
jgi:3-phenylpropionate/cinnamic acid dioxygenase small subunit